MDEYERSMFLLAVFACLFVIFMFGTAIFFVELGGVSHCFLLIP